MKCVPFLFVKGPYLELLINMFSIYVYNQISRPLTLFMSAVIFLEQGSNKYCQNENFSSIAYTLNTKERQLALVNNIVLCLKEP